MQSFRNIFIYGIMALLLALTVSVSASERTFEEIKLLAEKGDSLSQALLALSTWDPSEAVEWSRKSANQGNQYGQFQLGYAYDNGEGVPKDHSEALKWFRKSADQNNIHAQNYIGSMYEYGRGVQQNKVIAKEWYRKACNNGYEFACYNYERIDYLGY